MLGPGPAPLSSSLSGDGFFWLEPVLHDLGDSFFFFLFDSFALGCFCCCIGFVIPGGDGACTAAAVAVAVAEATAGEAVADEVLALATDCALF